MKNILFIQPSKQWGIHSVNMKAVEYLFYKEGEEVGKPCLASIEELSTQLANEKEPVEKVLVIPGEEVLLTTVSIPSKQAKQINKAVPYVAEEQLSCAIEEMHFVILDSSDNKHIAIAAVSNTVMTSYVESFRSLGVELDALIPDILLLPFEKESITFFLNEDLSKAYFKDGQYTGLVSSDLNCAESLKNLIQFHKNKQTIVKVINLHTYDENELSIKESLPVESKVESQPFLLTIFQEYKKSKDQKASFNLLQGKFEVNGANSRQKLNWKHLAIAAAFVIFLQISLNFITGFYLNTQAQGIQESSLSLYKELFPEDTRIVNIRTQMTNHLGINRTSENQADFMHLLGIFSAELENNIEIQFIRYSEDTGILTFEFAINSLSQLDELKNKLNGRGLLAEIVSATQKDNQIRGRMTIKS